MPALLRLFALTLGIVAASTAAAHEDRYLDAAGVKIRYIDTGKGAETIVLLHGGTSRLESWITPGVVDNLAKDFRVIAFDARGHGKSDAPREPAAYGRQQALDVVRIPNASSPACRSPAPAARRKRPTIRASKPKPPKSRATASAAAG